MQRPASAAAIAPADVTCPRCGARRFFVDVDAHEVVLPAWAPAVLAAAYLGVGAALGSVIGDAVVGAGCRRAPGLDEVVAHAAIALPISAFVVVVALARRRVPANRCARCASSARRRAYATLALHVASLHALVLAAADWQLRAAPYSVAAHLPWLLRELLPLLGVCGVAAGMALVPTSRDRVDRRTYAAIVVALAFAAGAVLCATCEADRIGRLRDDIRCC